METSQHDTGFGMFMLGALIVVLVIAIGLYTDVTAPSSLGALAVAVVGVTIALAGLGWNFLAQL